MTNNKNTISFGTILKRSNSINTIIEQKDCIKLFENVKSLISKREANNNISLTSIKSTLRLYIESMCNKDNASNYYHDPISLIERLNNIDSETANYLVNEYSNKILPYVSSFEYIREAVSRYQIRNDQSKNIIEAATMYNVADRILLNHQKISKRFNIEAESKKYKYLPLKPVAETMCGMIDTYAIPTYQKINLSIEEAFYLLSKDGFDFNKSELSKYVTEYFILRSDLTERDFKGIQMALVESYCLLDEDIKSVNYLFADTNDQISISALMSNFMKIGHKKIEDLSDMVKECILNGSLLDLKQNINKLVYFIWDVERSSSYELSNGDVLFVQPLMQRIRTDIENDSISKEDIADIIESLQGVIDTILSTYSNDYEFMMFNLNFKKAVDYIINQLISINAILYPTTNLEAIRYVNGQDQKAIPLNEFKIFKFNNLVKAALNLDKYLKLKSKKIYTKGNEKIRRVVGKVKDVLFGEAVKNMYSYFGEDNKADICVAQYYIEDSEEEFMHEFMSEICESYNNTLAIEKYTCKAYYIINPGMVELHVKESAPAIITDDDYKIIKESNDLSLDTYINDFALCETVFDSISEIDNFNIKDYMVEAANNNDFDLEKYKLALEALSFLNVSKNDIMTFSRLISQSDYCTENAYPNKINKSLNDISENWKSLTENYIPLDIQLEAYQIFQAITESDTDNGQDKKNNPFKGINLNSLKLYIEGLKSKMKDMSQKEKEISRNLDNNFRRLVKGMKDCLVSDRREAIIKNSVIPSFSKCCKIALFLVAEGIAFGNPIVPLLTAFGGFAASKRLTQKERILLLDEIETELDVVEKEISTAESKNQMKKYRTLLNYKKDLQRQYQRIRYNVRVGKDILPGSTAGMRTNN